jgi:hypothetical protein
MLCSFNVEFLLAVALLEPRRNLAARECGLAAPIPDFEPERFVGQGTKASICSTIKLNAPAAFLTTAPTPSNKTCPSSKAFLPIPPRTSANSCSFTASLTRTNSIRADTHALRVAHVLGAARLPTHRKPQSPREHQLIRAAPQTPLTERQKQRAQLHTKTVHAQSRARTVLAQGICRN